MSDFGNMLQVRTTKPHKCAWCGEEIPAHTECRNYRPHENERPAPATQETRQEHFEVMRAAGLPDEGDYGGQEHSEIMREIMGH
jgi:hypothetical protein